MPTFPAMPLYVRNDSFGPVAHNNLLARQDFLYDFLAAEHDPATGEHNTIHVARTLGMVTWSGAAYSLSGFNSDVTLDSGHNPTPGTVILTLPAGRYGSDFGIVEVQAADPSGSATPWVIGKRWIDDTHLAVYLKKNTSGAGAQQLFTGTDGNFFVGIRAPQLSDSVARPATGVRRSRGDGLRVDALNWNPMVQAMGTNRAAFLANHTTDGLHDCREVSKAWGVVTWSSAANAYSLVAHEGLDAGIQTIGTGQCRVLLSGSRPSMVAPVQAFATPLSVADGANHSHLNLSMVPSDSCGATSVDVFLYVSQINVNATFFPATITYRWIPGDVSFFIRVHGA